MMVATEQRLPPPGWFTRTFTYPKVVELGAEITGPGIKAGGGDEAGTTSYLLISFQELYLIDGVMSYIRSSSINIG